MSQNHEFPSAPNDDGEEWDLFDRLSALNRSNRIDIDNKKAQEYERIINEEIEYDGRIPYVEDRLKELNENSDYIGQEIIVTGNVVESYVIPHIKEDGAIVHRYFQQKVMMDEARVTWQGYTCYMEGYPSKTTPFRFRGLAASAMRDIVETPMAGRVQAQSNYLLPIDGSVEITTSNPTSEQLAESLKYFAPELLDNVNAILEQTQNNNQEFLQKLSAIDFSQYGRLFDIPDTVENLISYINLKHQLNSDETVLLSGATTLIIPDEENHSCTPYSVTSHSLTVQMDKIEFSPPLEDRTQKKTASNTTLSLSAHVLTRNRQGEKVKMHGHIPLTPELVQETLPAYGLDT